MAQTSHLEIGYQTLYQLVAIVTINHKVKGAVLEHDKFEKKNWISSSLKNQSLSSHQNCEDIMVTLQTVVKILSCCTYAKNHCDYPLSR